jgi:hypothetical protein
VIDDSTTAQSHGTAFAIRVFSSAEIQSLVPTLSFLARSGILFPRFGLMKNEFLQET